MHWLATVVDWGQTDEHIRQLGIEADGELQLALFPLKGSKRNSGCRYVPYVADGSHRSEVEKLLNQLPNYSLGFILNPGGTQNTQIKWCRCLVSEDDNPATDREYKVSQWERCGLPRPSLQVWTGGKSVHNYWVFTEPVTPDEFRRLQKMLFAHISAADELAMVDTSLSTPAQLLRLAGGTHPTTGNQAFVLSATGERFTAEQLEALITPGPNAPGISRFGTSNPAQHAEDGIPYERLTATQKHAVVVEALRFAPQRGEPGSGTYPAARDILAALVHEYGVDLALELAAQARWSQEHWDIEKTAASLVDAPEMRKTIWSVFTAAQANGWVCPWPLNRTVKAGNAQNETDPLLLELKQFSLRQWIEARAATFSLADVFHPDIAAMLGGRADAFPVSDVATLGPFITTMSSVLGKRYLVEVKKGHREPMIFWIGTVAPASSLKTPVANQFLWPLKKLDGAAQRVYKEAMRLWKTASKEERATPPQLPRQRVVVDATLEGLASLLERDDTYGVVSFHDELAAFIGDMDKYRANKSDRAHWLSMWSGGGLNILRKGSDPIHVEATNVSLFGAIQQDKLVQLLYGDDAASKSGDGFWARFLWVVPPFVFPETNLNEVEINQELMALVERLDAMSAQPIVARLSSEAWQLYAETADEFSREAENTYASRAAFLGKLRGYTARFAGLLHALDHVANDGVMAQVDREIPRSVMERAVILSRFFLNQFDVLAPEVGACDLPSWVTKVVEYSKSATNETGIVTPRDLVRKRIADNAKDARQKLEILVRDYGLGELTKTPRTDQLWWKA